MKVSVDEIDWFLRSVYFSLLVRINRFQADGWRSCTGRGGFSEAAFWRGGSAPCSRPSPPALTTGSSLLSGLCREYSRLIAGGNFVADMTYHMKMTSGERICVIFFYILFDMCRVESLSRVLYVNGRCFTMFIRV